MHRLASTLAVAASLALAACGGGTDDATMADTGFGAPPPAPPAMAAPADAAPAGDLVADVTTAAAALEGGVANVPLTTAGPLLERIEAALAGTGDATLGEVGGDLGRLRAALTGGTATGPEIGQMMTDLGGKVTTYAATAPAGARPLLERLGTALTGQGNGLRGQ